MIEYLVNLQKHKHAYIIKGSFYMLLSIIYIVYRFDAMKSGGFFNMLLDLLIFLAFFSAAVMTFVKNRRKPQQPAK